MAFKTELRNWRSRLGLTQQSLADFYGISRRNIQNWEAGLSEPPTWSGRLLLEDMKKSTEERYEAKMKDFASRLPSDKDGKRPEVIWSVISHDDKDFWIKRATSMMAALEEAAKNDEVACIMVNRGSSDFYTDRDGNIFPNHEGFVKGAE